MADKYYAGPVFNGTCCGVNCQDKDIHTRYYGVCGIGGLDIYNSFKCLDHLQPGYTLDYDDWQNIVYAAHWIAKKNNWFENIDPRNPNFGKPFKTWDAEKEEFVTDQDFYNRLKR